MNIQIQIGNSWMYIGEHNKNIHRITIYRKNETIYSTLEYISPKLSLRDLLDTYHDVLRDHIKFFDPNDYRIIQTPKRIKEKKKALIETYKDFNKYKGNY